jgi:hypothetical protein
MIEQEQVQVTQADRDAAKVLWSAEGVGVSMTEGWPEAFARHRHTATAEALEAMREAREALGQSAHTLTGATIGKYEVDFKPPLELVVRAFERLTDAIAKIEGQQP